MAQRAATGPQWRVSSSPQTRRADASFERAPHSFPTTLNTSPCTSTHPQTEYNKIVTKTALGFVVMGTIGFFVKLIFIVREGWLCCGAWVVCVRRRMRLGATPPPPQPLPGEEATHSLPTLPLSFSFLLQPINQIIVGGSVKE
jgi:hypothetical protein